MRVTRDEVIVPARAGLPWLEGGARCICTYTISMDEDQGVSVLVYASWSGLRYALHSLVSDKTYIVQYSTFAFLSAAIALRALHLHLLSLVSLRFVRSRAGSLLL